MNHLHHPMIRKYYECVYEWLDGSEGTESDGNEQMTVVGVLFS